MKTNFLVMLIVSAATFFVSCRNGKIKANTMIPQSDTSAQLPLRSDSVYTCEMDDSVLSAHGGKCPECGMDLVKKKITPAQRKLIKEGEYIQPKE